MYHNAFNFFLTYYLKVLPKGPLPSAESVCAVCDWSIGELDPWPWGPGSMWLDVS